MFENEMAAVAASAAAKAGLLKKGCGRYLLASVLAGLYVGFGMLAMSTTGGVLTLGGHPLAKIINAAVFPVALSLVVFAGSELFTGNTFVMTAGWLCGRREKQKAQAEQRIVPAPAKAAAVCEAPACSDTADTDRPEAAASTASGTGTAGTGAQLITAKEAAPFAPAVSGAELAGVWAVSYLGNLLGSVLCALLFAATGLLSGGTLEFVLSTSAAKMSLSVPALLSRGIFCNILVCLAVWCGTRMKSESGKLIMIFWCIFAFVICGFEHSIANMTMLTLSLLAPHGTEISLAGMAYNLFFVTLGNVIGGAAVVGLGYFHISGGSCGRSAP